MFTILDYSNALEYSIIRRYTNIVYYYYIIEIRLFYNKMYSTCVLISEINDTKN